ncbi:hypothetical protein WS54_12265 [Burkholderia sp. NRF60-BP8]|nr:hypothetical protein WS54_12265 [Burkholderia sp. NRF60-BP8]
MRINEVMAMGGAVECCAGDDEADAEGRPLDVDPRDYCVGALLVAKMPRCAALSLDERRYLQAGSLCA